MVFKRLAVVVLVVVMAGCATTLTPEQIVYREQIKAEERIQRELAFKEYMENRVLLRSVLSRVMTSAIPFCGSQSTNYVGIAFATQYAYVGSVWREAAIGYFDLGESVKIIIVDPGSPADKAGLKTGDIVTSVNGTPIRSGVRAMPHFRKQLDSTKNRMNQFSMLVKRTGGQSVQLTIKPTKMCNTLIRLEMDNSINAYADRYSVHISQGLVRFVESDAELALVVGHELAHVWLGHPGLSGPSQALESIADYLGLYLVSWAGYPIDDAPLFWRRMGLNQPSSITQNYQSTHPSTAHRFVKLKDTIAEIKAKQAAGEPLDPELGGKQYQKKMRKSLKDWNAKPAD